MPISLPDFMANEKFRFLYSEPYRTTPLQILYGGAASGKSVDIAQRIIIDMVNECRNFLVVKNVYATIRDSAYAELEKAINRLQMRPLFEISGSALKIVYKPRGNQILFRGLDDTEKLKSITVSVGTVTDIWGEEATEFSEHSFDDLGLRMRGASDLRKRILLSFNPIFQSHWICKRFFKGQPIKYFYDGKMLILHSTHRDNNFLAPEDHTRIEAYTGYHHSVYADGEWGVLGSIIFNNVEVRDLSDIKDKFDVYKHGLDFGFAADPSAYLRCGYKRAQKEIYIVNEVYGRGWTNPVVAKKVKPIAGEAVVWCDCAEPKSIAELQEQEKNSLTARGVSKGKDSVLHGIQWLQQHKIIVDCRCQNTINELLTFQWKKDKQGNDLPEPVGTNDHSIAALRYAFEEEMSFAASPDIYLG